MKNFSKANSVARQLFDTLSLRIKAQQLGSDIDTIRQATDANGWPMIFISNGSEAAGQPVVAFRISGVDAVSKDILGNALTAYAPHLCEVAYESAQPVSIIKDAVMLELGKFGAHVQVKKIAAASAVTAANMDAASPELDIEDINWPTKSL